MKKIYIILSLLLFTTLNATGHLSDKDKKAKKKDQDELDARYDYDGDVDTIIDAASKIMMGKGGTDIEGVKATKKEDAAANNVGAGNVDMAPTMGKKKKKTLLSRRGY